MVAYPFSVSLSFLLSPSLAMGFGEADLGLVSMYGLYLTAGNPTLLNSNWFRNGRVTQPCPEILQEVYWEDLGKVSLVLRGNHRER